MITYSRNAVAFLLLTFILLGCSNKKNEAGVGGSAEMESANSFTATTADGFTIYGRLHRPKTMIDGQNIVVESTPLILAFHQGGASGEAEYAPIIPRLLAEGFAVMPEKASLPPHWTPITRSLTGHVSRLRLSRRSSFSSATPMILFIIAWKPSQSCKEIVSLFRLVFAEMRVWGWSFSHPNPMTRDSPPKFGLLMMFCRDRIGIRASGA